MPRHLVKADSVEHERQVEGEDRDIGDKGEQHEICGRGVQKVGEVKAPPHLWKRHAAASRVGQLPPLVPHR